jgi:hypothetical protein
LPSEQAGSDYVPDDQVSNSSTKTTSSNNVQEKAVTPSPEKSIKDGSPNKVCAVIVGVTNASNVKRLEKTIKKAGYTPFSYISKGLTRVGAACECNQVSIDATMADMQKINADAWLYELIRGNKHLM